MMSHFKVTVTTEFLFQVNDESSSEINEIKNATGMSLEQLIAFIGSNWKGNNDFISEVGRVPSIVQFAHYNSYNPSGLEPWSGVIIIDREVTSAEVERV